MIRSQCSGEVNFSCVTDECAINLTPDMEGGSEFVSGNGEALLPNSYSAHVRCGS